MSKILCTSDLHGKLPKINNKVDILLISGDICPVFDHTINFQDLWIRTNFKNWLKDTESFADKIIFTFGNHDFIGESTKINKFYDKQSKKVIGLENSYCLIDEEIIINGLKIFGTPGSLPFHNWSFNYPEDKIKEVLAKTYEPDIILSHGPPKGFGDAVWEIQDEEKFPVTQHTGSVELREKILEDSPMLVVYGHIHSGYGKYQLNSSLLLNSSYLCEDYKSKNKPWEIEIL